MPVLDAARRIMQRMADLALEVAREYSRDRLNDLAAGVTFFMVFAIPAAALAFTAFLGQLGAVVGENLRDDAKRAVSDFMREEIAANDDLIGAVESLFDQQSAGLFTVGVLIAILAMSRGFAGLVRALDVVYDLEEERSFVNVRVTAIGLALGTIVISGLALAAFVVGPVFGAGSAVAEKIGLGSSFAVFWDVARGPTMFLGLILWAGLIFHFGPDHRTPWRSDLPGALVTGLLWLVLSMGFGLYVDLTSGSNQVIGIIATALVAFTWLYLTIVALLVGAELNAVLAQQAGISKQRKRNKRVGDLARQTYKRIREDGTSSVDSTS